jgi:hypothetical protein
MQKHTTRTSGTDFPDRHGLLASASACRRHGTGLSRTSSRNGETRIRAKLIEVTGDLLQLVNLSCRSIRLTGM